MLERVTVTPSGVVGSAKEDILIQDELLLAGPAGTDWSSAPVHQLCLGDRKSITTDHSSEPLQISAASFVLVTIGQSQAQGQV